MQEYHKYIYEGPVMEFDRCIADKWLGETMAPTEKKEHGKVAATKITLPGKIQNVEEVN